MKIFIRSSITGINRFTTSQFAKVCFDQELRSSLPCLRNASGAASSASSSADEAPTSSNYGFGNISRVFNAVFSRSSQKPDAVSQIQSREARLTALLSKESRSDCEDKVKDLVRSLKDATSGSSRLLKTEDLNQFLIDHPELRSSAIKAGAEAILVRLAHRAPDEALRWKAHQGLALLGHIAPPNSPGIRLLSIDGGGTRGMMALEILGALEAASGKRIHELFDFVVGCSTGAMIATLLIALRLTVPQCTEIYREMSRRLFTQNRVYGVRGLVFSHSYYNTSEWITILKEAIGLQTLIETIRHDHSPKLCIVSCVVNQPVLGAFVFRNYNHPSGRESVFPGAAGYPLWRAIQATAAAPGYFEEVKLGEWLHQDGGVLANNPAAVGVHESRLLWPEWRFQCVVSIGNGRSVAKQTPSPPDAAPNSTTWKEKLIKIVDSATDTEMTHTILNDLVPQESYFRLNPYITYPYTLDEIDPKRLDQMHQDVTLYVRKNMRKVRAAAALLTRPPPLLRRFKNAVLHRWQTLY